MQQYHFNEYDIQRSVLNFILSLGILPANLNEQDIILDGQIHRFKTREDKGSNTAGSYCIFTQHWPAGWVQDWRKGDAVSWTLKREELDDEGKSYFDDETYKKNLELSRKHQEELRKQREHDKLVASENARILFEQTSDTQDPYFAYLQRKGIHPHGVKFLNPYSTNETMLVPIYNINGVIQSIQYIDADGNKKYFYQAPISGGFFPFGLGDNPDIILVGEGYATMATVYELTGYPCVAAMDCGNLLHVCMALKGKYTNSKIIITADNDTRSEGNPGISRANHAKDKLNLLAVIAPTFSNEEFGSDWNDYYLLHGKQDTKRMLLKLIQWQCMNKDEQDEFLAREKLTELAIELDKNIQIPPEDFIGGIFPRKRISAVIAPPGTGKTWFLQKSVSDLSVGGSIFDGFAEESNPHKCLVFAGEAGTDLMIRRATETDWPVNKHNVKMYGMIDMEKKGISIMLDEDEGRNNIARIIDIHHPDIVFFDTLSSFHNSDENKSQEMKPIFRWLLTLADRHNIAVVLMHHSRKRLAKERKLALNQDDAIGSSIFNRLISVIISIEPTQDDNKTLMVKVLKSWFQEFMPFTYKLVEGENERTVMKVDLAPEGISNAKTELWDYLRKTYAPDEWFKASDVLQNVKDIMNLRQLQRYLASFVVGKKLKKKGQNKWVEYALVGFYDKE